MDSLSQIDFSKEGDETTALSRFYRDGGRVFVNSGCTQTEARADFPIGEDEMYDPI